MKQCSVEGCKSPVFGKGYCRYHQYLRTDTKKNIKVRVDSGYVKACKIVDSDSRKRNCIFCGRPILGPADHHHTEGREGDNLCDAEKLYRAHRKCHNEYHHFSVSSLLGGEWYRSFLRRIKVALPEVYKREVRRLDKAGIIMPFFLYLCVSIIYSLIPIFVE